MAPASLRAAAMSSRWWSGVATAASALFLRIILLSSFEAFGQFAFRPQKIVQNSCQVTGVRRTSDNCLLFGSLDLMRSERRPVLWQSKAASKHSLRRSRLSVPHPFNRKRRPLSAPIWRNFCVLELSRSTWLVTSLSRATAKRCQSMWWTAATLPSCWIGLRRYRRRRGSQREDSFQS